MIETTRKSGLLVAALALLGMSAVLGACSTDPFVADAGTPIAIQTSRSLLNAKAGTAFQLTGQLLDNRMTPLPTKLDVSTANAGAVVIDSTKLDYSLDQTVAYLHAPSRTAADSSTVTFSGANLSATTKVVVTP